MQERTRYRLSGTVFLVALAVIFLPMLFDGAGVSRPSIPEKPVRSADPVSVADFDEVVPVSDVVSRVSELANELDADGFDRVTATKFGEPVLSQPGETTTVWAVQAGSFAQVVNARQFRSDLREVGFEAFISTVRDREEGVVYRVAVGPLLSGEDAQQIVAQINQRFEVDAQIQTMRP